MAHTNVWSNIIPAGSDALNTADDQIRQLRLDIQERMDEVVDDWTADPVVPIVPDVSGITGTPDCARVYTSANITVLTGVEKTMTFNQESFDPGGFHDNATNNERLTVVTAGYYVVHAQLEVAAPDANASNGFIKIYKNGVLIAECFLDHDASLGADSLGYPCRTLDLAAADDYYEVRFTQGSGSSWTVQLGAAKTYFEIFRLTGTT